MNIKKQPALIFAIILCTITNSQYASLYLRNLTNGDKNQHAELGITLQFSLGRGKDYYLKPGKTLEVNAKANDAVAISKEVNDKEHISRKKATRYEYIGFMRYPNDNQKWEIGAERASDSPEWICLYGRSIEKKN